MRIQPSFLYYNYVHYGTLDIFFILRKELYRLLSGKLQWFGFISPNFNSLDINLTRNYNSPNPNPNLCDVQFSELIFGEMEFSDLKGHPFPLSLRACQVDVAVSTSSRHANVSKARRLAVARKKLTVRRLSSNVLSQDCLGLPTLRRQSLIGPRMYD